MNDQPTSPRAGPLQLSPYETALLYVCAGDPRGPRLIEGIINSALSHLAALGFAQGDPKAASFSWRITETGKLYLDGIPKEPT